MGNTFSSCFEKITSACARDKKGTTGEAPPDTKTGKVNHDKPIRAHTTLTERMVTQCSPEVQTSNICVYCGYLVTLWAVSAVQHFAVTGKETSGIECATEIFWTFNKSHNVRELTFKVMLCVYTTHVQMARKKLTPQLKL